MSRPVGAPHGAVSSRARRWRLPEDSVIVAGADLAYTVGFERGKVVVDGGAPRPMAIRVTHIYRRFGNAWKLVHRHADFQPTDQRKGGGG